MTGQRPLRERIFLLAAATMLLLPLFSNLLGSESVQSDNRRLAEPPAFPDSWGALVAWPHRMDAYLDDHFGLRRQLVSLSADLRWNVLKSSPVASIVRGRNGRIFLSDGDVPLRTILGNCGAWWSEDYVGLFARELAQALPKLREILPGASVLVIPTSAVLYPQDLPAWIAQACSGRRPLAEELLRRLPESLRQGISYPQDIAATLPASTPLVPMHNFHWEGMGIHTFMGRYAERNMNVTRQASPSWVERVTTADLALYVPGVGLSNPVTLADWSAAGVRSCADAACADRAPLNGVALSREGQRLERPGGGGRLLMLGDSFLAGAADALIGYFDDIITINLNNFPALAPDEQRRLWDRITKDWQPTQVLMLVNDGNIARIATYTRVIAEAAAR